MRRTYSPHVAKWGDAVGISIYYQARRSRPLTSQEQRAIDEIVRLNEVEPQVNEAGEWVDESSWPGFCIYPCDEDTEPDVIFEGATKLPMSSEDDFWDAIQHWCRVLTLIRRVLADATWAVHIDDADIAWDEERKEYDPTIEVDRE